jgi:putative methyltransferase (TIGR04325 family)
LLLALIRLYRRIKNNRYGWFGNYTNWQRARQKSSGYDAANILEKVKTSTLKVKKGEAAYERSSVLYDRIGYSWPLLANLFWIAQKNDNHLSVVDYGGALGTSYFQNRHYLNRLKEITWSVVEQEAFVKTGQKEIAEDGLGFFFGIDEALAKKGKHQVLLISCVLPYLEKPYEFLEEIRNKNFSYIIIDNTYFNPKPADRLTIQKVPPFYYEASYPAWFLDYDKIKTTLLAKYELVEEYVNEQFLYFYGEKINYKGFIMKLKI